MLELTLNRKVNTPGKTNINIFMRWS